MSVPPAFYDLKKQRNSMDKDGIDRRVITLANPWFDPFPSDEAIELAYNTNRAISLMVAKDSHRFFGMAALPLADPKASVKVLRSGIKDLGLGGAIIGSNFNGTRVSEKRFWPIYEEAARLDVPIFVHPTEPRDVSDFHGYGMMPGMAFPFETTVAAIGLIYSGLFVKYPKLKLFVPHLGGALPYLASRIDRGYDLTDKSKRPIPQKPSVYLKRNFYSDTIVFDANALACGVGFFGPSHLTLGTDFPFPWGDVKASRKSIRSLGLLKQEIDQIEYLTALRLLKKKYSMSVRA